MWIRPTNNCACPAVCVFPFFTMLERNETKPWFSLEAKISKGDWIMPLLMQFSPSICDLMGRHECSIDKTKSLVLKKINFKIISSWSRWWGAQLSVFVEVTLNALVPHLCSFGYPSYRMGKVSLGWQVIKISNIGICPSVAMGNKEMQTPIMHLEEISLIVKVTSFYTFNFPWT